MTTTGDHPDEQDVPGLVLRPIGELPVAVRNRIVQWAADAVGAAPPASIPQVLARVARFAPAKRAKSGAAALAQAIESDAAFRSLVAERAVRLSAAGTDQDAPADAVTAAAKAYLLRLPDESELLAAVATGASESDFNTRVLELERDVRALTARLERATADVAARQVPADADRDIEAQRLRLRLREQGSRLRGQQQAIEALRRSAADDLDRASAERDRALEESQVWRQRAETASARGDAAVKVVERLRRSAGERRAASDRRLELLLGAIEGAASGLRREWDLQGGGPAPADVVAVGLPAPPADTERTADPSRLMAWASLPGAHLIVDGYNVTKTGFAELSLSEQRDRLVRSLAALAARTSAEVTVVFDGAAVATARPPARGVRVLFSPPGVLADKVINDLVRAEPLGRVVVVVTSDREVVDRAATDGARTAASLALLGVLGGAAGAG